MATANSEDQPIWVQDLIAWLKKIEGQGRTEQWVALVQEVLAELPGQGLPEEFWSKDEDKENVEATEAVQDEVVEEPLPLSDEDRARIQQELKFAKEDDGYWNYFNIPLRRFKAAVTKIPAIECKLLKQALAACRRNTFSPH